LTKHQSEGWMWRGVRLNVWLFAIQNCFLFRKIDERWKCKFVLSTSIIQEKDTKIIALFVAMFQV